MSKNKTSYRVFEYQSIRYPSGKHHCSWFKKEHFDAFSAYKHKNENTPFFELIDRGVRFKSYVGAIRIGKTTIEVLPKADKEKGNENKWQEVLLDMLKTCHLLKAKKSGEANLKLKANSVFELYFELFVNEVEQLIRQGLIKKYRKKEGNRNALKGALVFSKHITKNIVHKEKFYVRYTDYNKNHIEHQILFEALLAIQQLNTSSLLSDRIGRIMLDFPIVNRIKVNEKTFSTLVENRKTAPYQLALDIAELILLNYRPDIKSGSRNLLAIMFDMNVLWEEYVYRVLRKYQSNFDLKYNVLAQQKKKFWSTTNQTMNLKPDVLIEVNQKKYIIDTKWKKVKNNRPEDQDIRQMFAYNQVWKSNQSILLYPGEESNDSDLGVYSSKLFINSETDHHCLVGFINVMKYKDDKKGFAKTIFKKIVNVEHESG
jgi:5-methylcytosine-specific restriction enzyme subunit McrC